MKPLASVLICTYNAARTIAETVRSALAQTWPRKEVKNIESPAIADAVEADNFAVSTDSARIREAEAVFVCVPTLLSKNREPDISYIIETGSSIAPHLQRGQGRLHHNEGLFGAG